MHLLTKVLALSFTGPIPMELIGESDKANVRNAIFLTNSFGERCDISKLYPCFLRFRPLGELYSCVKLTEKLTETN